LPAIYREEYQPWAPWVNNAIILLGVAWLLAGNWLPLGPENPVSFSLIFIILTVGIIFRALLALYEIL
jgi:copper/silver efflux system protein